MAESEAPREIAIRLAHGAYPSFSQLTKRERLANAIEAALNAERERCAKIAEGFADVVATEMMPTLIAQRNTATNIAAVIRGKD